MKVIEKYVSASETFYELPLFLTNVSAGFPSPADDYIEKRLDLNDILIKHPSATFFVKVEGNSMKNAGIESGDLLVIDRSLTPSHGKIVVAIINGEFTVKRFHLHQGKITLLAENVDYPSIPIHSESDFQVWGVVTYVIHKPR